MHNHTPKCAEISVSASVGGKVQIVKFEFSSDYHFTMSGKWSIPEEWDDKDAEDFRNYQLSKLREELEPVAQKELDALIAQRDNP